MMLEYYKYKTKRLECNKCYWEGLGKDCIQGQIYEDVMDVDCPKCSETIASVLFPTAEEMLQYGSEEEKTQAKEILQFQEAMENSLLKSIAQLPEIKDGNISFEIVEKTDDNYDYLNVVWNGEIVWEEIIGYEYWDRFIELGKMFKEKYGSKLIDFVPKGDGYLLYGDNILAPEKIQTFRNSLR